MRRDSVRPGNRQHAARRGRCGAKFGACRNRRCQRHGARNRRIHGGDRYRVLLAGLVAYAGPVAVTDITAPGAGPLPWDRRFCEHPRKVACSGTRGCRVRRDAAVAWNATVGPRYRRLHELVCARLERAGIGRPTILAGTYELQRRGVLHRHLVLGMGTPAEKFAANAYVRLMAEHAPRHGWGFVERRPKIRGAKAAAVYLAHVARYVGKEELEYRDDYLSLPMHRSPTWVRPECRQASGATMEVMRDRRRTWAYREGLCGLPRRLQEIEGLVYQRDTLRPVERPLGPLREALAV